MAAVRLPAELDRERLLTVKELPRLVKWRRAFLHRHVTVPIGTTLEVGAMNTPTIRPGECHTTFLDWFSTEELRARHIDNPRVSLDDIVEIDYVVKSREIASAVTERVDLAIANHVIEHVPDPIFWLDQLWHCVKPQGLLFLSVPDRRYTFDYYRRDSDPVELVRAHQEGHERPTADSIARHLYYLTAVSHEALWAGEAPPPLVPRMSFPEALEKSTELAEVYTDVHSWVYTTESFTLALEALQQSGHIKWKTLAFEDVLEGQNEMRVLLQRS